MTTTAWPADTVMAGIGCVSVSVREGTPGPGAHDVPAAVPDPAGLVTVAFALAGPAGLAGTGLAGTGLAGLEVTGTLAAGAVRGAAVTPEQAVVPDAIMTTTTARQEMRLLRPA
jgi:hypothetical protein